MEVLSGDILILFVTVKNFVVYPGSKHFLGGRYQPISSSTPPSRKGIVLSTPHSYKLSTAPR